MAAKVRRIGLSMPDRVREGGTMAETAKAHMNVVSAAKIQPIRELDDSGLVAAFLNGEKRAFNELVARYHVRLLNFIHRTIGDRERAEDFLQDLFTKIAQQPRSYSPGRPFGTWLYNYTELTQKGSRITFEANEIPNWEFDNGDHIARLMTQNAIHAKRNVEDKIFRGKRHAGDIANDIPSTMGGFPTFIPSENRVNLSGYPVDPYDIESIGATLWDSVGDAAAKTLIMSMRTARMFDGIMQKYRQADMDDDSMNLQFKKFSTRFGEFQIAHTRTCPDGVIYGVNFNNLSLHPFKGMDWTEMEHTGVNGAYKWRSIFGRFTLVAKSPETMFEIYGFSNDLTNYGRIA